MELKLTRKYFAETYTVGHLFVDDTFLCDTLEDKYRRLPEEQKIYGQTAIPPGKYRVIMSYSTRFERLLPEILNVPYFDNIRIHSGNTSKDTMGCPLVGRNTIKGSLTQSREYSDKLNLLITEALKEENVFIDIV
jgi:hypothetical protein